MRLVDFEVEVKYKKGKINTQEDAMSTLNTTGGEAMKMIARCLQVDRRLITG